MLEICDEKEKASLYFSVQDDGIGIEEAYDGQQALERIRQSKEGEYDLILMDIMMPVMDGLEQPEKFENFHVMTAKHFQSLR